MTDNYFKYSDIEDHVKIDDVKAVRLDAKFALEFKEIERVDIESLIPYTKWTRLKVLNKTLKKYDTERRILKIREDEFVAKVMEAVIHSNKHVIPIIMFGQNL